MEKKGQRDFSPASPGQAAQADVGEVRLARGRVLTWAGWGQASQDAVRRPRLARRVPEGVTLVAGSCGRGTIISLYSQCLAEAPISVGHLLYGKTYPVFSTVAAVVEDDLC